MWGGGRGKGVKHASPVRGGGSEGSSRVITVAFDPHVPVAASAERQNVLCHTCVAQCRNYRKKEHRKGHARSIRANVPHFSHLVFLEAQVVVVKENPSAILLLDPRYVVP